MPGKRCISGRARDERGASPRLLGVLIHHLERSPFGFAQGGLRVNAKRFLSQIFARPPSGPSPAV